MRETPRAKQAWADYLALGPSRSFEKLLQRYHNDSKAPSHRLKTVADWSRAFGWQARLDALAQAEADTTATREAVARALLQAEGIRNRQNRLAALNDRAERMKQVIRERAEADEFAKVAGGTSGVLVRQWKIGRDGTAYEEFAVDTGLLAEMRAHEKQAAQELGEWTEKSEIRGSKEAPLVVEHLGAADVRAAELAFLRSLGLVPGRVGDQAGDDHSSAQGADALSALSLPDHLPDGPLAAAADRQGPADRV